MDKTDSAKKVQLESLWARKLNHRWANLSLCMSRFSTFQRNCKLPDTFGTVRLAGEKSHVLLEPIQIANLKPAAFYRVFDFAHN